MNKKDRIENSKIKIWIENNISKNILNIYYGIITIMIKIDIMKL